MRYDTRSSEQLRREIGYYVQELQRTKSPDRLKRAHIAIQQRERALGWAIVREAAAKVRNEQG